MNKLSLVAAFALVLASITSARALEVREGSQGQNPTSQAKTVLLDVPAIAERVNEVVVNIRSTSESGESLGSGFIIDQRGFIATNFHLISSFLGCRQI